MNEKNGFPQWKPCHDENWAPHDDCQCDVICDKQAQVDFLNSKPSPIPCIAPDVIRMELDAHNAACTPAEGVFGQMTDFNNYNMVERAGGGFKKPKFRITMKCPRCHTHVVIRAVHYSLGGYRMKELCDGAKIESSGMRIGNGGPENMEDTYLGSHVHCDHCDSRIVLSNAFLQAADVIFREEKSMEPYPPITGYRAPVDETEGW